MTCLLLVALLRGKSSCVLSRFEMQNFCIYADYTNSFSQEWEISLETLTWIYSWYIYINAAISWDKMDLCPRNPFKSDNSNILMHILYWCDEKGW
ncbi:unnamed protein product [Onchocerca flexuosa]|uniref:Neur_chan_LBD domain-containing protein n=1 Tax=Onchocerca flexuosa TaxID=387005 RepID=A0A183I360_9BILA|nr:unnamed protein product [Onchocerca flexuosa]